MGTVTQFPGTMPAADPPAGVLEPADCALVTVPGQKMWHTHICEVCGSSWTHIAPTPMTQGMNKKIHTCTKCGTFSWKFVAIEEPGLWQTPVPVLWVGVAMLGGALIQRLLDRR
jgi:hypothetical protein